jgi:phage N-6-adenine-methyltransferase
MNTALFFESAGDERGTPQDFFDQLNAEFHFDLDAAAGPENHKCELYYGTGGLEDDALEADWQGVTAFLNPPYSVAGAFVKKAREEADKGAIVVMLLPVRSDTRWWHNYVYDKGTHTWRPGIEVRLLPGRLNFTLSVPDSMRAFIKAELDAAGTDVEAFRDKVKKLVEITGLPKMSIARIGDDQPDDCLLDAAPFPSCVVIFRQVGQA